MSPTGARRERVQKADAYAAFGVAWYWIVEPQLRTDDAREQPLGRTYFDLEQPGDQTRLDLAWDDLVNRPSLVVLDEAQAHPALFGRLRGAIDRRPKQNGRFLLLGSVAPSLMREVSESLVGRLALVELTPLTLEEVGGGKLDRLFRFGGFPDGGILRPAGYPAWQTSYLSLMAQRDLPTWAPGARSAPRPGGR